jgi:hypothetical protein
MVGCTEATGFGNGVSAMGGSSTNPVLVRYDATGIAQWASSTLSGSPNGYFFSVAVDSSGAPIVAGQMNSGSSLFGPGAVSSNLAILVKYDSSGTARWAQSAKTSYDCVMVDDQDKIYVAGVIFGTSNGDFGNGISASGGSSSYNTLVVRYSDY